MGTAVPKQQECVKMPIDHLPLFPMLLFQNRRIQTALCCPNL